jgi:hypothetical protein
MNQPTTYGEAAKVAETVTDAEIRDLLTANTLVFIFPAPRAWQRVGFVECLTVDDGWRRLDWEAPETRDLPHYAGDFTRCEWVASGKAIIHILDTGRTIRL